MFRVIPLLSIFIASSAFAGGPTITNITSGLSYDTIADAITASIPGDIIELGEGTFNEFGLDLNDRHITIQGQGRDLTFIDAQGLGRVFTFFNGDESMIESLTIENGAVEPAPEDQGSAVKIIHNCSPTFLEVDFRNCDASEAVVRTTGNNSFPRFEACRFLDNSGNEGAYNGFGEARFVNCLFDGHDGAHTVRGLETIALYNCTFVNNDVTGELWAASTGAAIGVNCVFDGTAVGATGGPGATPISYSLFPGATGATNINGIPTFEDALAGDYRLATGSLGIDAANADEYDFVGGDALDLAGAQRFVQTCADDGGIGSAGYLDMGAYETFDPSIHNITQGTVHASIQEAIDLAGVEDVIELGPCTFYEWDIDLVDKNITIRGQGRDVTIIDADHQGRAFNIDGFVFVLGVQLTFESMSIVNGVPNPAPDDEASGAWIGNDGFAVFIDVDFRNCDAATSVVHLTNDTNGSQFNRCRFIDNPGEGGLITSASSGAPIFTNCLFDGHDAVNTMRTEGGPVDVLNCTFVNNDVEAHFNADASGQFLVQNCVFDGTAGAMATGSGDTDIIHSLFPGATGSTNIDGLPTFEDAETGDYRLAVGSLGIDSTGSPPGPIDLAGSPRFVQTCAPDGSGTADYLDMGAYETYDPSIVNVTQGTIHGFLVEAIEDSSPGDLIELGPCTIDLGTQFTPFSHELIDRNITIRGQGPGVTTIDILATSTAFRFNNDSSTMESLTVRRGEGEDFKKASGAEIQNNCNVTFNDVEFIECGADFSVIEITDDSSVATFNRCRFIDNTGDRGAYDGVGFARFVNCLFKGHNGAWTMRTSDSLEIVNSTFAANSTNTEVRATSSGLGNVIGSVFDGTATAIFGGSGITTSSFSLYPGAAGEGDMDGVPTFDSAGDYRLAQGSLGIDAANAEIYDLVGGGALDLSGEQRFVDDAGTADQGVGLAGVEYLDMGAFEFQGSSCVADLDGSGDVGAADLAQLLGAWGPNPEHPADLNQDGTVGAADLAIMLGAWGACSG